MRKAIYIQEISEAVHSGEVDLPALEEMSDDDVIAELTKLRGVGGVDRGDAFDLLFAAARCG